jgi:hypothetical protein
VRVADNNASDGASATNERGVLANLPRTRPQRSTPRRTAARGADAAAAAPSGRARARSAAPRARSSARSKAAGPKSAAGGQRTAPVQGFECEAEATGSVQPPGAVELVSSIAEVVSELAKAGASRGERLLRDLASRLPGS